MSARTDYYTNLRKFRAMSHLGDWRRGNLGLEPGELGHARRREAAELWHATVMGGRAYFGLTAEQARRLVRACRDDVRNYAVVLAAARAAVGADMFPLRSELDPAWG